MAETAVSVVLFLMAVVAWPLAFLEHPALGLSLLVVNTALLIGVWRTCRVPGLSYWKGLNVIVACMRGGWAAFDALGALLVLTVVYPLSVGIMLRSLVRQDESAGRVWAKVVTWFYVRRFGKPPEQAPTTPLRVPDPQSARDEAGAPEIR